MFELFKMDKQPSQCRSQVAPWFRKRAKKRIAVIALNWDWDFTSIFSPYVR
jgi:hypothetical protein